MRYKTIDGILFVSCSDLHSLVKKEVGDEAAETFKTLFDEAHEQITKGCEVCDPEISKIGWGWDDSEKGTMFELR